VSLHNKSITAMATGLALLGAGCGGEEKGDPIPADQRAQLLSRLDEAERRLDDGSEGACQDILNDTQPEVENVVATLPDGVDADLRQRLEDGLVRLWELVTSECEQIETQEPEPEPTPEPAPLPEETTPETVPTVPEETDENDEGNTPPGQEKKQDGGSPGNSGDQGGIDLPGTGGGGTVAPGEG
jgi:hypothetical protein